MPSCDSTRYRATIWIDHAGNPVQAALAHYVDDVKQTETTFTPGPFDSDVDVLHQCRQIITLLPEQQVLPSS